VWTRVNCCRVVMMTDGWWDTAMGTVGGRSLRLRCGYGETPVM
jgi:hypothetical protein